MLSLDWSHAPRWINIFQRRGSLNILRLTRCVQRFFFVFFWKNSPVGKSITFQSYVTPRTQQILKSSGTWCIRKYYFNIKSPSTLEPKHYKTPIQLSCAGRQPDEAKGLNIQMSILEFQHVHWRQKQTCLELCDMFEVFCHSRRAACMICTSARIRPRPVRHPLHMSPEDLRPQLSAV